MRIKKVILLTITVVSLAFCVSAEVYARTSRSYRDTSRSRVTRSSRPSSTKVVHRTVTHTTHVNHVRHVGHSHYRHNHYHNCHHHHHHGLYCSHGFFFHECPHYHDDDGGLINIDISL